MDSKEKLIAALKQHLDQAYNEIKRLTTENQFLRLQIFSVPRENLGETVSGSTTLSVRKVKLVDTNKLTDTSDQEQ